MRTVVGIFAFFKQKQNPLPKVVNPCTAIYAFPSVPTFNVQLLTCKENDTFRLIFFKGHSAVSPTNVIGAIEIFFLVGGR